MTKTASEYWSSSWAKCVMHWAAFFVQHSPASGSCRCMPGWKSVSLRPLLHLEWWSARRGTLDAPETWHLMMARSPRAAPGAIACPGQWFYPAETAKTTCIKLSSQTCALQVEAQCPTGNSRQSLAASQHSSCHWQLWEPRAWCALLFVNLQLLCAVEPSPCTWECPGSNRKKRF